MERQDFQHTVSSSDIRRFKECRGRWLFSSSLGYNRVPKKTRMKFAQGRAWHEGLYEYYSERGDIVKGFEKAYTNIVREDRAKGADYLAEDVQDILDTGRSVLSMYPAWAEKHDDFKIVLAEQRLIVPLRPHDGVGFSFKCDQIVERRSGLWIHDFKTTDSMPSDFSFLDFDEQLTAYIEAAERHLEQPVKGAIFTYLWTKAPSIPGITNKGAVSRAQIVTTPQIYFDAVKQAGGNVMDYADFIRDLQKYEWFQRVEVVKSPEERAALWADHQMIAREMIDEEVFIYFAPTRVNCTACSYQSPCLAARANNWEWAERILEAEYVVSDYDG